MADFTRLPGTLYVGARPDPDAFENDVPDHLYSHARFTSDTLDLVFYYGSRGYYPVTDEHIENTGNTATYFPAMNETVAEPGLGLTSNEGDLTVYADDVAIEYTCINGDVYIRSQLTITAHAPIYLIVDDTVYEIVDPLLTPAARDVGPDAFLGLDETVEDAVLVRNVETGVALPLPEDRVTELVDNDDANGALRMTVPSDIERKIVDALS